MNRSLIPAALLAACLALTACGGAETRSSADRSDASGSRTGAKTKVGSTQTNEQEVRARSRGGDRLAHGGVSVDLPAGWEGRVLALDSSSLLQAANFGFATKELPPGEEDPIKAMMGKHVLVTILPCGLVSHEGPARPAPGRLSVAELAFLPAGHPRIPFRHAFASGSFTFGQRCLRIEADFGRAPPALASIRRVDAILDSLTVADQG